MSFSKNLKQTLQILIAQSFIRVLALLPLKACHNVGFAIGWLFYHIPNASRRITEINIQLCFPELNRTDQNKLVQQALIETGKTLAEASPMWKWEKDKLFHFIKKVHGEELIQKALNNKTGIILVFPHLGNWELFSLYCSSRYPMTTLYRKPRMEHIDSLVKQGRQRFGAKLVPADNLGVRAMYKALQKNEFIGILPDQEPGKEKGNGVFAPFFGIQTLSMTLVSRLAKKTSATVLLGYCKRLKKGQGYEIIFTAEPDLTDKMNSATVEESVAYLNANVESCIRQVPEQYQWGYKRFRTRPDNEKNFYP